MQPRRSSWVTDWQSAYAALVLIWGFSFMFNAIALRVLGPVQVATVRIGLGALTMILVVAVLRQRPKLGRGEWKHILVLAATMSALPFLLIAFAQTRITSILAGMLNATTPLWAVVFVALLIPTERANRRQLTGVLIGLVGLLVLLGAWRLSEVDWIGATAMLAATACYGFSTAWSRLRLAASNLSGVSLSTVQLILATLLLIPFALLTLPGNTVPPDAELAMPAIALLCLGVFGTGLAYVLMWRVLRTGGAVVAATVTYAIPVVSTAAGLLLLGEPLQWFQPVGAAIVLAGVALTQSSLTSRR